MANARIARIVYIFLPADLDPCDCGPVHAGAVFAAASFGEVLRDVALVPFVFAPRHARLAWDLRAVVRAGPTPAALDPTGELSRLGSCRDAPHLRVLHLAAFEDPLFEARLGACSLVVVLDAAALGIAAGLCGSSVVPALVDLSRAVGWQRGFGAPLSPLEGFLSARGLDDTEDPLDWVRACALRQAVLIGRLLGLRAELGADAGRSIFELLLAGQVRSFAPPRVVESCDARTALILYPAPGSTRPITQPRCGLFGKLSHCGGFLRWTVCVTLPHLPPAVPAPLGRWCPGVGVQPPPVSMRPFTTPMISAEFDSPVMKNVWCFVLLVSGSSFAFASLTRR